MGTVLGSIMDPAADKLLMTTMVVSLTMRGMLPRSFNLSLLDATAADVEREPRTNSSSRDSDFGSRRTLNPISILLPLRIPSTTCTFSNLRQPFALAHVVDESSRERRKLLRDIGISLFPPLLSIRQQSQNTTLSFNSFS